MTTTPLLTERERTVLRFLAEGLTPVEIGQRLYVTKGTVLTFTQRIRKKLGVQTNAQAILKAAWYHADLLAGCVVQHGNAKALDWHMANDVPLCALCEGFKGEPAPSRKPSREYRRLSSAHVKRGEPLDCGSIQAARRHIRNGERINDLTCACREAYQEWWREYQRNKVAG